MIFKLFENNKETNMELCERMLKDELFLNKIKQKLNASKLLILDSKIESASLYRDLCRLLNNLLSVEFEELYEEDDDEQDVEATLTNSKGVVKSSSKSKSKSARSNKSNRLSLLEFFSNFLDIPNFFIDFGKIFISNKQLIRILKEVSS